MKREHASSQLITDHRSPITGGDFLGAIVAGLIVTAFCFLLLWHDPLVFWNDDYELSILPVFADVARSWDEGHWPLLSPYSWVCNNLAGEFQYGTFSVFVNAAVVLIWKFPLTFPQQAAALSITHLFVLAVGAFLLAHQRLANRDNFPEPSPPAYTALPRGEQSSGSLPLGETRAPTGAAVREESGFGRGGRRMSPVREFTGSSFPLSIFVALIAALNGWIICWGATDWFGALGAFAWFPWCWWALERSVASASSRCFDGKNRQDADSTKSHRKRLMIAALWPAPFVYLLVTGGFPYTVLMLAVLVTWLVIKTMWEQRQSGPDPERRESEPDWQTRDTKVPPTLMLVLPMLVGVGLGFGMSAPAWLALLNYVHGSARASQAALAHWQWIVPWRALPGFVLPCWTVNWADFSTRYLPHSGTELACGLVASAALVATLISLGIRKLRRAGQTFLWRVRWELALLLIVLLLSMLPMFGVFRWSFRWLPFVHLVLALCAAEALRHLPRRVIVPATAFVLVTIAAVAMSILHLGGRHAFPLTWIFLLLAAIWLIADLLLPNESIRGWLPATVTFAALLATYFCIPPNCGVPKYNFSQELTKPEPLDRNRLYLAVYSPAEAAYRREYRNGPVGQVARPGSTSMWAQLHFINGYSPILSAGVAREFKIFIHGEIDGDFGKYLIENQAAAGGILEELGVDGIVIAPEIGIDPPASDWQLEFLNEDGRLFHRKGEPLPRVRSVEWIDSIPEREFETAKITEIDDSRNYVTANIDVPADGESALLTFSRPYSPGYKARLGNEILPIESYRGLFPVVEVPPGSHGRLILCYRPAWLVFGGAVALLSAGLFLGGCFVAFLSGSKFRRANPVVLAE